MISDLPHEREILDLVSLCMECHQKPNHLILAITDTHTHARYLVEQVHKATQWDEGRVRIYREGIEVVGGGKIVITAVSTPERLRGMRPDKVAIFGNLGELWYLLNQFDCPIVGVA